MIKFLCLFLDAVINPTIILVALIELFFLVRSVSLLVKFRTRITRLNSKKIVRPTTSKKDEGKLTTTMELELTQNWDEFDQFLEEYQNKGWWYSAFSLIIQIFTLLGILGTVAGLYIAMSNGEDMYKGVEMALSTTILGILFAVFYKIADIFVVSFLINYIEDGVNRYEKIYQVKNDDAKNSRSGKRGNNRLNNRSNDRTTDKETDRNTDPNTDKEFDKEFNKEIDKEIDKETEEEVLSQTNKKNDKEEIDIKINEVIDPGKTTDPKESKFDSKDVNKEEKHADRRTDHKSTMDFWSENMEDGAGKSGADAD